MHRPSLFASQPIRPEAMKPFMFILISSSSHLRLYRTSRKNIPDNGKRTATYKSETCHQTSLTCHYEISCIKQKKKKKIHVLKTPDQHLQITCTFTSIHTAVASPFRVSVICLAIPLNADHTHRPHTLCMRRRFTKETVHRPKMWPTCQPFSIVSCDDRNTRIACTTQKPRRVGSVFVDHVLFSSGSRPAIIH